MSDNKSLSVKFSCAICQSEKNLKACTGCGNIFYCSVEHQKHDWKQHKGNCRAYRVSSLWGFQFTTDVFTAQRIPQRERSWKAIWTFSNSPNEFHYIFSLCVFPGPLRLPAMTRMENISRRDAILNVVKSFSASSPLSSDQIGRMTSSKFRQRSTVSAAFSR